MLERIVGSTSPSRNIYEIVDDNNNCYKSMMINLMRMNYSYSSESLCVYEEPNIDVVRFF
jgi:hypothetical protein